MLILSRRAQKRRVDEIRRTLIEKHGEEKIKPLDDVGVLLFHIDEIEIPGSGASKAVRIQEVVLGDLERMQE